MAETFSRTVAAPGRIARNTSAVTRLSLVVVLVALVSLVTASIVGLYRGSQLADDLLESRLSSIGAARSDEVTRYFGGLERAVLGLAVSPSTATAIGDFDAAYRELQAAGPSAENEAVVDEYYRDEVAPELSEARGRPVSAASLVPRDPAAVHLQANYTVSAGDDAGLVDDAGDGSRWSEVHSQLHQSFDEFAVQVGVDDLYLIEPVDNIVVYSTDKLIDFAESLVTGPQSGSALAALINSFDGREETGVAVIQDYRSYAAAGEAPSAFVAAPVFSGNTLAGYVAIRIGTDELSAITTNNGTWEELGDSGETYVVASDDLMRSDARGFLEDTESFLDAVAETGTATPEQVEAMARFDTTATFLPIDPKEVRAALAETPDLVETTNYLGVEVLLDRRPIEIEGLEWALFTEIDREEIEKPIAEFARNLLISIALFLVAITFVAVRWSNRLLRPLRVIAGRLRSVRATGDTDVGLSSEAIPADSPSEFVSLAVDIDTMLDTLAERNSAAAARASERRDLLHRILPPQAARRAEAGERNVIDQVAQASVVVLVVQGLGPLMRSGATDDARALLDRFVEEADALAKQRGLERIRLTGDSYFAACGTVRPQIDHAARSVGFALDVADLTRDLRADSSESISLSAAVDSGPVTVGLTGGSGLVFDAWGSTVQRAADLARRAAPMTVAVSASVRSQLPPRFVIDGEVVTGRMPDGEVAP